MNYSARFVLSSLFAFGLAANCFGWNAKGHKTIADIAWKKLDSSQRDSIASVLRQHPRFAQDFQAKMQSEIPNASQDEQNHWIFCHAAVWPDIARGLPGRERGEHHRPRWHYINLPVFLDESQASQFAGQLGVNVSFDYPVQLPEDELNGVQAVKNSIDAIIDSSTTDAVRAVHYCWLLHVVGDLHQPHHGAALFTASLFPQGDRGGNLIRVRRSGSSGNPKNLHSVWDGLLGRNDNFNEVQAKANQLVASYPGEYGMPFVALPNDVWSTETQQLALQSSYEEFLDAVRDAEENGNSLGVIELPESYFQNAGDVSGRQAVIAGVRIAGLLTAIDPVRVSPRSTIANLQEVGFPAAIARRPATARSRSTVRSTAVAGDLPARVKQLEAEVNDLRAQLAALEHQGHPHVAGARALARVRATEASHTAGSVEDGEQCTCGADE